MELQQNLLLCEQMEPSNCFSQRDQKVIWHPFSQASTEVISVTRAKGAYLYAQDGTAYLDAISSWWVNLHGHAHPHIAQKIASQALLLEHVLFAGFTHPPAVELAEKLTGLTGMSKVFYSDNGSTAVETALKMTLQLCFQRNSQTKRKKFLSFCDGYHGETFGAMSVSGKNVFNRPFWDHLFAVEQIQAPFRGTEEQFLDALRKSINTNEIAGFIFEPSILGVGGMKTYAKEALNTAIEICRENEVLTIADEVMTGFGRTGPLFVCDTLSQKPDLICLSKAITGGFLPLGATLCSEEVYKSFLSPSLSRAFLHGHSYTANPLACSAALGNLELLLTPECQKQRGMIQDCHQRFCQKFQNHAALVRCEALGTLLILEYRCKSQGYFSPLRDRLYRYFLDQHLLIRPFGNVVHVMPPYCITPEELAFIYTHLAITLEWS